MKSLSSQILRILVRYRTALDLLEASTRTAVVATASSLRVQKWKAVQTDSSTGRIDYPGTSVSQLYTNSTNPACRLALYYYRQD
jgi:hypothetical protein